MKNNVDSSSMDLTSCIICQQSISEQLSCPQQNSKYDLFTVYENFLLNVEELQEMKSL